MNALSIGAGIEQLEFIKAARRIGWTVFAVDKNPESVGFSYADYYKAIDIADANSVVRYAEENKIAFTLPSPVGRYLTTVGAVNSALGLSGPSLEMTSVCTDKVKLNAFLRDNKIPRAEQRVAYSREELIEAVNFFNFRCVVKPRFGSGSVGVVALSGRAALDTALKESDPYFKDGVLAEELLEGDEYGLDLIFINGDCLTLAARKKKVTPLPWRQELGYINTPFPAPENLDKILNGLLKLVKTANTLCHIDLILNKGKVYIIELAFRASGYNIFNKMLPRILDTDIVSAALNACYTRLFPKISGRNMIGLFFLDLPAGTLTGIPNPDDLRGIPQLIEYDIPVRPKDRIGEIKNGKDALSRGYIMLKGDSEGEILSAENKIINMFRVTRLK